MPITSETSVSSIVHGNTRSTSPMTGWPETSETPQSPRNAPSRNTVYCLVSGRSRPSRCRRASIASRLAWSPRISCAGSPGTIRTSTKTSVSTANSVTQANARRRTRNAVMAPGQTGAAAAAIGRNRSHSPVARLLGEARLLRDRRRQVERALDRIPEIERVLPRPELQLLVDRNTAHRLDDLLLRGLPQRLLL